MERNSPRQMPVIRQSYAATYMKQSGTVHAVALKIKYRALQALQPVINQYICDGQCILPEDIPSKERTVVVDLADITTPNNYKRARGVGEEMAKTSFTFSDEHYRWQQVNLIARIGQWREDNGRYLEIVFTNEFLQVLTQKGGWISFYNANVICGLNSTYSMRIYEMISRRGSDNPLFITFDDFKEYLGLQEKSTFDGKQGPINFDNKVLGVARDELKEKTPYSFDSTRFKDESGRWCYVLNVRHYPKNEPESQYEKELAGQITFGYNKKAMAILKDPTMYGFTDKELKPHRDLLLRFEKETGRDLVEILEDRWNKATVFDNPKGYIINTLKDIMENG